MIKQKYKVGDLVKFNDWSLANNGRTGVIVHLHNASLRSYDGYRPCYRIKVKNSNGLSEDIDRVPEVGITVPNDN